MSDNSSSKARKGRISSARHIVQALILALFCIPPLAVGMGLFGQGSGSDELAQTASTLPFFGSLSSTTIFGLKVMDPFAMLEAIAASKAFDPAWLLAALPVLVLYGLIRGRAFCGWACPVNFALEGVDFLRAKLGIKVAEHAVPRHAKLWIALAVLVLCALTGTLVFEVFSPISAINKGIVFGSLTGLVVLGAIVVAELFWGHRVWCRSLCPLGGMYEALGRVGFVSVKMDSDRCIHCDKCRTACICDPDILDGVLDGGRRRVEAGDCMLCGKCIDICPTEALSLGVCAPTVGTPAASPHAESAA